MGRDKATLSLAGEPMAVRLGRLLSAITFPTLEVGPGHSGLPSVREEPPGQGPLVAVAAGARALGELGSTGPAIVVACDLVRLTPEALELLACWPTTGAVVPEVDGHRQPLCARWAAADLATAVERAAVGQRAIGHLPAASPCTVLTPGHGIPVDSRVFADADRPEDLRDLGLVLDQCPLAAAGPVVGGIQ
jgi:molybdopterin-guanine dinucleotide biosynthesis protein A